MLGNRRFWQVAAAVAAAFLCALIALAGPGSIQTFQPARGSAASSSVSAPNWTQPCFRDTLSSEHPELAFCARISGRVVYSGVDSGAREAHVLVLANFHMIMVELPAGVETPGWGAHITAVGPLLRARNGQREVQAVWVRA